MYKKKRSNSPLLTESSEIKMIAIDKIIPNPSQPRTEFNSKAIISLADSIKKHGLLQPISVRQLGSGRKSTTECKYELIAGERRLKACRLIGETEIPCVLVDVSQNESAELALIENLLREDLNMFEEARAFSMLSSQYSLTQEEIAAKLSTSQSTIANKMRLLRLSEQEQDLILSSELSERHARALLRLRSAEERADALNHIITNKLNVSQTDEYITSLCKERSYKNAAIKEKPEIICLNIMKYISKIQKEHGNIIINRKSDDKSITVTLTIKKSQEKTSETAQERQLSCFT